MDTCKCIGFFWQLNHILFLVHSRSTLSVVTSSSVGPWEAFSMLFCNSIYSLIFCFNYVLGLRLLRPTTIFRSKQIDPQSWSQLSKKTFPSRSISYCAQVCVRNAKECRAFVYRGAIQECELTYAKGPQLFVPLLHVAFHKEWGTWIKIIVSNSTLAQVVHMNFYFSFITNGL